MAVCERGHVKLLQLLLKYKPDININKADRKVGVVSGCGLMIQATPSDTFAQTRTTPLLRACLKSHVEVVRILLEHDADVTLADKVRAMVCGCSYMNVLCGCVGW